MGEEWEGRGGAVKLAGRGNPWRRWEVGARAGRVYASDPF